MFNNNRELLNCLVIKTSRYNVFFSKPVLRTWFFLKIQTINKIKGKRGGTIEKLWTVVPLMGCIVDEFSLDFKDHDGAM